MIDIASVCHLNGKPFNKLIQGWKAFHDLACVRPDMRQETAARVGQRHVADSIVLVGIEGSGRCE